jgi:uncharacterized protein YdcH (DUF465 family)
MVSTLRKEDATMNTQDALELAARDDHFRELQKKHQEHEREIASLAAKGRLTEEEDFEEKRLKKEKLAIKDQMEELLRRYRESATV